MASDIQQSPFLKELAANDRPTRDRALTSLTAYLIPRRQMDHLSLLKIWKALFFSLWHCDRPIPQQRLTASLASLPLQLQPTLASPFLRAFWETMAREWGGIDVLRLNKYLLLVRRYVRTGFELVLVGSGSGSGNGSGSGSGKREERMGGKLSVEEYLGILEGSSDVRRRRGRVDSSDACANADEEGGCWGGNGVLNGKNGKCPDGLRYHVLDVWVDELIGALGGGGGSGEDVGNGEGRGHVPLEMVMGPVRRLKEGAAAKGVRVRAREVLEDERLQALEDKWDANDGGGMHKETDEEDGNIQNEDTNDDDEWEGFAD